MATVDYEHMSRNGEPPRAGEPKPGNMWWAEEGDALANEVRSSLEFMRNKQSGRLSQWVIASRLYGNQATNRGPTFSFLAAQNPALRDRISWNVVQAVVDTVTSKTVKNKPKPLFATSGGDWRLQRKAKKLNQFIEGVFYENKAYILGAQIVTDTGTWGDGVVHVYAEHGRVKFERVIASELWVDDLDGFYGSPRSMHRVTDIDRYVLISLAKKWLENSPKKEREEVLKKIKDAKPANPDNSADYLADKVTVAESWHLPSAPDADDGVHAISIDGCTLFRDEWKHDCFPFAVLKWASRLHGYWGQGLAEQLQNLQFEINTLLQTIKQSFWKGGTFRVFLPSGSRLVKEHITNQIGSVVSYTGDKAPVVVTPQLVQQEIFAHLENLWRKAFEQAGVSELHASGEKPPGLDAGAALREYNDIQTDRFMKFGQAFEEFFLDLARLAIMTVKDITAGHSGYKVKVPQRGNAMKEIDWKDVNLTEEQYVMRCFPVSSLPTDPAGRMQTIVEWVEAGWITPRQGRRLMDMPDLDMADSLATAAEDYLTEILEEMLYEDGPYVAPEPYDDLVLARELALEHYQRGKVQHVPEERLQLLRDFLAQLDEYERVAKVTMQAEAASMSAGAPGAGPQDGAAGPPRAKGPQPPTSDLVPNEAAAAAGPPPSALGASLGAGGAPPQMMQ